jgi:hypothetical protein
VVPAAYSVLDDLIVWNDDRRKRGVGLVEALRGLRAGEGTPAGAR